MELYKHLLKKTFERNQVELEWLWTENVLVPKSEQASENHRKQGNDLYLQETHTLDTHREILKCYNASVMYAPLRSEHYDVALGNRSAFLMHIQKYEECIKDIDTAVRITRSIELKIKLLCRKIECLKKLDSSEILLQRDIEEIEFCIGQIRNDKTKRKLLKKLKNVKALSNDKRETNANDGHPISLVCSPKVGNVLDQIEIRHSEKYGRYTVAAKDYKPGDIIFIEDLYAATIESARAYISCHYCFRTVWSGIPCDECVWAIFCSEDCKRKAWMEFHDIECSVYSYIIHSYMILKTAPVNSHISLRLLIRGLKECGNPGRLRQELQSVDVRRDAARKGFYRDEEIPTSIIRSIYSLKDDGVSDSLVEAITQTVPSTLIGLVRCPNFPINYNIEELEDLLNDDDLMFLGALLIKFAAVYALNGFEYDPEYKCEISEDLDVCEEDLCCQRAVCVAPFASLINHSCFPNASRFFTDDRKIVLYAMHPIEKNSQIFITYFSGFHLDSLSERQQVLSKNYSFDCDCKPCLEEWPIILDKKYKTLNTSTEKNIFKRCENVISRIRDKAKPIQYDRRTVELLSKSISEAFRSLAQPSYLTCLLVTSLNLYYKRTLCFQPESFGECDQFSSRKFLESKSSFKTCSLKDTVETLGADTTFKKVCILAVVIVLILLVIIIYLY